MQAKITLGRRVAVFVLTVLTAVYCNALPCFAQSAVGANGEITELVVGRNNKGPYMLSWTEIDANSVWVTLDSRTLRKGSDYNIDTAKGVIAFDRILVTDAIVRVTYKLVPGKSKATTGSMNVPVSLNLVSRDDANLSITGLYTQGDPKKPDSAKTIVGLGGNKIMGGTKLNSQFMVSQRDSDGKANDDASTWDKAVVKFGTETKMGGLTLTSNFAHAGMAFGGAKEYKTDLGKEALDIALLYTTGQALQTSFKFKKTDDTAASAKGTYGKISEQSIGYSPLAGTRISFTRNSTETGTAAGMGKLLDTTSMKLDQKFGNATSAVASMDTSKTTTGGKVEELVTRSINFMSKAIPGISFQASSVDKSTGAGSQDQVVTAAISSDATKKMSFTAGINNTDSKKSGASNSTNYSLRFADRLMQMQFKSAQTNAVGKDMSQQDILLTSAFAGNGKLTADMTTKMLNDKQDKTFGAGLEFSPVAGMGLSVSHRDSSFANAAKTIATDMLKIAQRFGMATSAMLSLENTSVRDGSKTDDIAVRTVAVNTTAIPGTSVQVSNTQKVSSQTGTDTISLVDVKVAPAALPGVRVGLTTNQTQSTTKGNETKTSASFGVAVPAGVDMQIATTQQQSTANGEATSFTGALKIAPKGVPISIQGSGTQSQSVKGGNEQNIAAAVAFDPFKALSIKANVSSVESRQKGLTEKSGFSMLVKSGFAQLSASMTGTVTGTSQKPNEQYQREVNLTSTPVGFAKIVAQFTQKGVNDKDDVTKAAMLELAPFSHTRLRTGLKYIESGTSVLTIRDYGAETNPWGFISLSGSFRDREAQVGVAPDTKNVKVAFKPISRFSVTGEYAENPEDAKTGAVQAFNTTGLGVNWRIGSVGVVSNYTSKEEYMASRLSDERKLGLEMKAFGGGNLTTGVKLARVLTGCEMMTRTYSLGFKHDMGSDFNILLSGYYTESLQDRVILDDRTEVGAELKFGTKF